MATHMEDKGAGCYAGSGLETPLGRDYGRLTALLELVESRASLGRSELLTLCQFSGEVAGTMMLEDGMVHLGVQLRERVPIDETLHAEAPQLAQAIERVIHRHGLATAAQELAPPLAPPQHAALCGLTTRTLRKLATSAHPGTEVWSEPGRGWPLLRLIKIVFSPLELLLAAGRLGPIDLDDPAVRLYGAPPSQAEERWLFAWQPDGRELWPIMSTRLSGRRIDSVAAWCALGQRLLRSIVKRPWPADSRRRATLLWLEQRLCLLWSNDRYATLLVYPASRFEHCLGIFAELLPSLSTPEPALAADRQPASPTPTAEQRAEPEGEEPSVVLWERPPDGQPAVLSLRGLGIRLGACCVLANLHCDVAATGVHLLISEEGGEKRVLIRALCGPRPAQMQLVGCADYLGRSLLVQEGPATPRSDGRLLMMTVGEYLMSNLPERATLTRSEQRERACALVLQAGSAELLDHFDEMLVHLDVAARRSLEILRAVAPRPALLVLDEPLDGVSPVAQAQLLALIRTQAEQRAVLVLAARAEPLLPLAPRVGAVTSRGFRRSSLIQ